jgi:hypothetical protein
MQGALNGLEIVLDCKTVSDPRFELLAGADLSEQSCGPQDSALRRDHDACCRPRLQ